MNSVRFFLVSLLVVGIDQAVKLLVHFNMAYGLAGEIEVLGQWFKLHYTLNPGMAFGLQLGSEYGKILLSVFRLVAVFGISIFLHRQVQQGQHVGYLYCLALILGGAVGNVVDSTLYGVLLGNAPAGSPTPWFHGQVVDMFYFDIWEGFLPEWLPVVGGQFYSFWPIFNVADASIFCGIVIMLIFQNRFFPQVKEQEKTHAR